MNNDFIEEEGGGKVILIEFGFDPFDISHSFDRSI